MWIISWWSHTKLRYCTSTSSSLFPVLFCRKFFTETLFFSWNMGFPIDLPVNANVCWMWISHLGRYSSFFFLNSVSGFIEVWHKRWPKKYIPFCNAWWVTQSVASWVTCLWVGGPSFLVGWSGCPIGLRRPAFKATRAGDVGIVFWGENEYGNLW